MLLNRKSNFKRIFHPPCEYFYLQLELVGGFDGGIIDDAIITINDAIMASMIKQYHSLGIETLDVTRFEDALSQK